MATLRRVQFVTVLLHSAVLLWIVCRYIFVSNPGDYMMKLGDEWFFLFWADIPATAVLVFLDQVIPDSLDSALAVRAFAFLVRELLQKPSDRRLV